MLVRRLCCLLSALALVAGWMLFDYGVRLPLLWKYPPELGAIAGLKFVTLGLAAFSAAVALWSPEAMAERRDLDVRSRHFLLAMVASFALLALPVGMMLRDLTRVADILGEFSVVEMGSAAFLGAAALLLFLLAAKGAPGEGRIWRGAHRVVLALMGLTAFLILMEEISWGQHYLGFATPEILASNDQREANFHNFYTWQFENLYYGTAVLVFIALPFFWSERALGWTGLGLYVPPPSFTLIALPIGGMTFEMWNIPTIQFGFLLSIVVGVLAARMPSPAPRASMLWALAAVGAVVPSQTYFLLAGGGLVHNNAVTEFKEFSIAFLVFAYAAWLFDQLQGAQVRRLAAPWVASFREMAHARAREEDGLARAVREVRGRLSNSARRRTRFRDDAPASSGTEVQVLGRASRR
jgi:hypothetical protein